MSKILMRIVLGCMCARVRLQLELLDNNLRDNSCYNRSDGFSSGSRYTCFYRRETVQAPPFGFICYASHTTDRKLPYSCCSIVLIA